MKAGWSAGRREEGWSLPWSWRWGKTLWGCCPVCCRKIHRGSLDEMDRTGKRETSNISSVWTLFYVKTESLCCNSSNINDERWRLKCFSYNQHLVRFSWKKRLKKKTCLKISHILSNGSFGSTINIHTPPLISFHWCGKTGLQHSCCWTHLQHWPRLKCCNQLTWSDVGGQVWSPRWSFFHSFCLWRSEF